MNKITLLSARKLACEGFNGDYVGAEMVKSFIVSGEYRQRFGP